MKAIVTTTINPPTEAIEKFASMNDWTLIVSGDRKTPKDYKINGVYLSPEDQEKIDLDLSNAIGWNCIQRRNFSFIEAYKLGADIIATIDDDNIPLDGWGKHLLIGDTIRCYDVLPTGNKLVLDPLHFCLGNEIKYKVWHRGYPIQLLKNRKFDYAFCEGTFDIQADMWIGDPDIDAICRMEHSPYLKEENYIMNSFPFSTDYYVPFNSQNTFIARKALKDYFMFPHIGRMDDIWAAYYVESLGYKVVFNGPSVRQERNNDNLTRDFNNEIIGYSNNLELLEHLKKNGSLLGFLPPDSRKAFRLYRKHFE